MKIQNRFLISAILMALSLPALATQPSNDGPTCNGSGSCATNNTTTNNTTNQGGAGGHAYAGAIAGAKATGGNASATGGNASATVNGSGNSTNHNTNTNLNSNSATVKNDNTNQQQQGQLQGQQQGQGQQQSVKNSGNNTGTSSVVVTGDTYEAERIPVSSAIAPTIFPTAPCMGSSSIAGSGALISLSGGTSWTSEECMILETARSFDQAGYQKDGLAVRCQGKWAKSAPSCKALAEQDKPVAAATPAKPTVAAATPKAPAKSVAVKSVAQTQTIETAETGYYSVNTNPLTK